MSGELVQEGLVRALWLVAPVAGAAAGAALVVGWLAHRLGVADPVPVLVARAAVVLALVGWFGPGAFAELAAWTRALWSELPAIGRG